MQPNGLQPVSYGYDGNSRLTQITQGTQTVTLTYDAANRRTTLTLPNGVTTTYTHDTASRLTALTYTGSGGSVLGDLTYAYDPNGNRLATGGVWAGTGIPQGVLTSSYDAANQQLGFGSMAQTFDANGNLLTQTDPTGTTTTFTWDARNRLMTIAGPTVTASFAYDALGRRVTKTVNGVAVTFHYDGMDMILERGQTGDAAYLRTLAIDETLTRTDATGIAAYLTDALGSTVTLTTAAGAVSAEYVYEPFGTIQTIGPSTPTPFFQFSGRENDGTGLYYYRTRYYDPDRGRFIAEDLLGLAGGINLYAYVGNNPLGRVDPFGLLDPKCADCPSGKWSTIELPNWSVAPVVTEGKQGALISFTCVDNGVQCIGTSICSIRGPIAGGGIGIGGGQVTMARTGADLGGFSSGYTLSILFLSSGVTIGETGTAQGSVGLSKSWGGGYGEVNCETTILGCVR
jgi:RHS repeat-associated protein